MNKIDIAQLRQMNADRVAQIERKKNDVPADEAWKWFKNHERTVSVRAHDQQAAHVAGGVDDIVAEVERRIKAGVK